MMMSTKNKAIYLILAVMFGFSSAGIATELSINSSLNLQQGSPTQLNSVQRISQVPNPTSSKNCIVTRLPENLGLAPFYKKYCSVLGIPIVSSDKVPDKALQQAADIVVNMLSTLPDLPAIMLQKQLRVGVMGVNEVTTNMPEHSDLTPADDWNKRARGLGATLYRPLVTGAEENLLCYQKDPYRGENIFLHEFAHTIKDIGLVFSKKHKDIDNKLQIAFDNARKKRRWKKTYAETNINEYWAEGVQSYFDSNLEYKLRPEDITLNSEGNGIHNYVNTRQELKQYDPELYTIIESVFAGNTWRPKCPSK